MYIKLSYDQEFDDLYMHLRSKYPKELFDLDGIGKQLDMHQFAKSFYGMSNTAADVSIDANANVAAKDVITYNFEMPKPFHKLNSYYLLWKKLRDLHDLETANAIIEMQLVGDIYINDFWDIGRPYCFNFSTYDIALEGLPMGDRVKPVCPKSLYSFVRQVEQFTVYAANSTLGATGLADLLIVMAWFVDKIKKDQAERHYAFLDQEEAWAYVKEVLSSFIYTLNWQFRGNQSPFTNVSLYDHKFLEELVPHYQIDGEAPNIETVWQLQKLFMEIMNEELRRAPLTFPVTTACFAVDADGVIQDEEFLELVSKQNLEFGFMNIYCGKSSTLSSCCRLRSDSSGEYFNAFGAGSTKIGSLGVVTVNLPRIAKRVADVNTLDPVQAFALELVTLVHVAGAVNNAKRQIIAKRIERGNLPLYKLGHMDLKRQYSTVGITGFYEALELLGVDIRTGDGIEAAKTILQAVNECNDDLSKEYGYPHNVEQVPAENSSITLASKDRLMGIGLDCEFYSNQFLPLVEKADMLDRIYIQGELDRHFSGGAICHLNVGEEIKSWTDMADLIKHSAGQGVIYFAVNYVLALCPNGHGMFTTSPEKGAVCHVCKAGCDTFTRVVGFMTNTKNWHRVRREHDWPNRQFYQQTPKEI